MNFFVNFLISIDQLGNVLTGGNPDNTISSRVGYYTERYYLPDKVPLKWKILRNIINFTFYPIDGENHCKEAYFNDAGEEFDKGTSDIAIAVLAMLIIASCFFIAILFYFLYAFGIVSPKKINRSKNIKQRLRIAEAKLKGVHTELNEHKIQVDKELDEIIDETQNTIEEIAQKIEGILRLKQRLAHFKKKKQNTTQ
ncbi:hypothetical protein F7018_16165 [Tenacibaculum aiptasiae]|uniref:Uncharacterized protein n=1 Tax=Tenacibaculum aiptasiae TaxID=426481 RepID=A0A7J5A827_9FLAO|nr:hypothetical protein [Tenacibaculum aiptasiae]KAB1153603.1 hypothetical protein F7018_16165 [Tenacibaculum aiptasiae]